MFIILIFNLCSGKISEIYLFIKYLNCSGEFFASPAIALADSAVITSLGDQQVTEQFN
jgi:hypothetical protein